MASLWELIGEYIPPNPPDDDNVVEYIHELISNMREDKKEPAFIDAVMMLSGKSLNELAKVETPKMLSYFITGFVDNRVLEFKKFIDSLGI